MQAVYNKGKETINTEKMWGIENVARVETLLSQ